MASIDSFRVRPKPAERGALSAFTLAAAVSFLAAT